MANPSRKRPNKEKTVYRKCALFALLLLSTGAIAATDLSVASYDKVSSQRISRVVYKFTYTLSVLNNGGADAFGVTATVTSTSPHTVIVDGDVSIGDITAGSSKQGGDTFSFQHDRRYPFDPNALHFAIQSTEPPATVRVPYVQNMSKQQAVSLLQQAGLTVGETFEATNLTVPVSLVYGQTPVTGTKVQPGSAVDLRISSPPPEGGTTVPASWAGIWKIAVNYIDRTNNQILLEHSATSSICPNDVVGLTAINGAVLSCETQSGGDSLSLNCNGDVLIGFCGINISGEILITRLNMELIGNGTTILSGNEFCPNGAFSELTSIEVKGSLQNETPVSCELPRSSLSQSFLRHPLIMELDRFELVGDIQ